MPHFCRVKGVMFFGGETTIVTVFFLANAVLKTVAQILCRSKFEWQASGMIHLKALTKLLLRVHGFVTVSEIDGIVRD